MSRKLQQDKSRRNANCELRNRRLFRVSQFAILLFISLISFLLFIPLAIAQEDDNLRLEITQVDTTSFPLVRIVLLATDAQSAPIEDLSGLRLRENNIPVEFVAEQVPIGIDVVFVLDADAGFANVDSADETAPTRQDVVTANITNFAQNFMNPDGLDRVSIVVANSSATDELGSNGRYLIQDATTPDELISALANYEPATLEVMPFNEMMTLALDGLGERGGNGRFQTLLLFSDARWIEWQTDYSGLRAKAIDLEIPLNIAILGSQVDAIEQENADRLSEATRGNIRHLLSGNETDELYADWQQQGSQWQLLYQSLQTANGTYPLSVNLGQSRATANMELALLPPIVSLDTGGTVIRRVGAETTTPLFDLQPTHYSLSVQVEWPDGVPRRLANVQFLVNGQSEITLIDIEPNEPIMLDWDITNREEGAYQLSVQVVDELGRQGESNPAPITIVAERPTVNYPTPVPTVAVTAVAPPTQSQPQQTTYLLIALVIALLLLVLLWLVRRRRQKSATTPTPIAHDEPQPEVDLPPLASLIWLDPSANNPPILLESDVLTFGRDPQQVDVVLTDITVDTIHAKIRNRNGRYWLYDEGTSGGTFRNFIRLGLAPQELQHGDSIQIGKVGFRFQLIPQE